MPAVESHPHGHPCWTDLATTDLDRAKQFYAALFGWSYQDNPMGDEMIYSMAQIDGRNVAAIYNQDAGMAASGMPPMWNTYISVDDVDERTRIVAPAGGAVMMEPFDVLDSGRVSFVQDPSGAAVGLWQPNAHIGAQLVGQHGASCWHELESTDADAAGQFFAAVLGWEVRNDDQMGNMDYRRVRIGGGDVMAGIYQMGDDMQGIPSHWMVYWAVDGCDAAVEQAQSLGASVMFGPADIPPGRFAILNDPQGAAFAVITLAGM